ncbi:MAG: triple tyrosine motif-containing protein, partial [Bacteroidales bacterium]
MNTFSEKKIFFIFYLFFYLHSYTQNPGIPYVLHYSPKESLVRGNNYTIAQDSRGFLYIANNNGVLEFDGNNWNLLPIAGKPVVTQNKFGEVFVGGLNTFGKIGAIKSGKISYIPIEVNKKFGQIDQFTIYKDKILFVAQNQLYVYSEELQRLLFDNQKLMLFNLNNYLYVYLPDSGLMSFNLKKLTHLSGNSGTFFKHKNVKSLEQFREKLIVNTDEGLFVIENMKVQPLIINKNSPVIITEIKSISNEYVVMGTQNSGLLILNKQFALIATINQTNGLKDNSINSIFIDNVGVLWLSHDNGISKLEFPGAFSFYTGSMGLSGKVTSIAKNKKLLYVGTNHGVFLYTPNNNQQFFTKINGIDAICNKLISNNEILLCATDNGLYSITADKSYKLFNGVFYDLHILTKNNNIILATTQDKIISIDKNYTITGGLQGFNSQVISIAQESENMLWLCTKYHGLYSVRYKDVDFSEIEIKKYDTTSNLPEKNGQIYIYASSKGTLFSTSNGLYRYNAITKQFYKDDLLEIDDTLTSNKVFPIVEDASGNLWMSFEKRGQYEKPVAVSWNISPKKYTFIHQPFNRIKDLMCEAILPDDDHVVWFGGDNGLISLDFKLLQQKGSTVKTYIRKIKFGNDTIYCPEFYNKSKHFAIDYKNNSITFDFFTPIFESPGVVKHQYRLEGFDTVWSNFQVIHSKEYTNLPPGEYKFRVRAKDIYDAITTESVFEFKINRPFYATYFAYLIYILSSVFFIYIVVRIRSYQFALEKNKLEKIIAERT